ncbi:conserved hypothetical protein [Theileria equi strain WA]|uniref:CBS domain-containing protein n=1 Tax=Theileria equi strain WA TaxID=1537102 RepID=L1LD16_THEEQ|nr:conserved hypothetical protein [Theileria equi strain WA]EKX73174.1 conserved hypothetical protein [Theileria equi strain WA]|eukprot:XP_004832626.1 conserved hypothetical protein [Theileria equi strain WA]
MKFEQHMVNDTINTEDIEQSHEDVSQKDDSESSIYHNIKVLLNSTPLCALLQSHSKVVTVDSEVPLFVAFKALSHYHKDFIFVYDTDGKQFLGSLDEHSFVKFLKDSSEYEHMTCGQYLNAVGSPIIHKVPENSTAFYGLELVTRHRISRLFVWSTDRDVPIGYLTPSCFLLYIIKNVCGRFDFLDDSINSISTNCEVTIPSQTTLKEALNILITHDDLPVIDDSGTILSILNRRKVIYFALNSLRDKVPVAYSNTVYDIVKSIDKEFRYKDQELYVDASITIRNALSAVLLSNDRTLAYANPDGVDKILNVWDLLYYLTLR